MTTSTLTTTTALRSTPWAATPQRRSVRAHHLAVAFQALSLLGDMASAVGGFWIAYMMRYHLEIGGAIAPADWQPFSTFLRPVGVGLALVVIIFTMRGMYRLQRNAGMLDVMPRVVSGFTTVMAGVVLLAFFLRFAPSRLVFFYAWIAGIALMIAHRLVLHVAQRRLWRRGIGVDRVMVIGEGESGRRIMQALTGSPDWDTNSSAMRAGLVRRTASTSRRNGASCHFLALVHRKRFRGWSRPSMSTR